MSDTIVCPVCKGEGRHFVHVSYAPGHSGEPWQWINCIACGGTKVVSEERNRWIEKGIEIRKWRHCNVIGLREAAALYEVSPSVFSAWECGLVDNSGWEPKE